MKRIIPLLLLIIIFNNFVFSQQIDVQVVLVPPYSNQLDDYFHDLDKTIITLTNISSKTQEINLRFEIYRNGNTFIKANANYKISQPLILAPQEVMMLSGNTLDDVFSGFTIDDVEHNLTDEELFNLQYRKILPEGYYNLCVTAYDYVTDVPLSPVGNNGGCAAFTVQDGIPAEIISPVNNTEIPNLDNGISWSPAISEVLPSIEYQFFIRDVTGLPLSYQEASMMTELLIFEKTIEDDVFYAYNFDGSDPELLEGHTYQIDLLSKDISNQIKFKNRGYSQSVRFTIKNNQGNINLEAVYPSAGDTLPYEYTTTIVKFSPYSDNYTKYDFKYTLKDTETNKTYVRKDDNKWPHGALNYLKTFYPSAIDFEAQHIPLNKRQPQKTAMGDLIKGHSYRWLVKSTMTNQNQITPLPDIDASFVYGMTTPRLMMPKNKTQYAEEGDIELKWKAGTLPNNPLPPFKGIANINNNGVQQQFIGEVNEVWVLQLSTSKNFKKDSLIYCKAGKIHYDPENGQTYNETELLNNVYPNLDYTAKNLKEHTYYWRVVYLRDISKFALIQNKNIIDLSPNEYYISSPVWEFEIDKGTGNNTVANCGNCELEDIDDNYGSSPVDLATAQSYNSITIGEFLITHIQNLKGSTNGGFTGTGEVTIPFLNNIKIKVNLKNIKINGSQKIYNGIVEAVSSQQSGAGDIAKSTWDKIKLVKDLINEGGNAHDIPIGIYYNISGVELKAGITKIKFTAGKNGTKPTIRGVMDIMTYVEVPGYTNGWINMAASDICFNKNGVGSEFLLHPYNDVDLTMGGSGGYRLLIKGSKNLSVTEIKQNSSYLEFDCNGWKSFAVKADLEFSTQYIVPDSIDGVPGANPVKGHFSLQFDKDQADPNGATFKNWIAKVDMDPFQIKGLKGWGFIVKDAYFDNSDIVNPPNINFPQGYTNPALNNPGLQNTWGGFYLKDVGIKLPKELSSARPELSLVHDFIIDKSGKVTTFIGAKNLIDEKTGDLGGWAFSLDNLGLQIIKNELTSSFLDGKLGLPLTHKDEFLKYSALLQKNNSNNNYEFVFNVKPQNKLHFELFVAMATIDSNSAFTVKVATETTVKAMLHGSLMIGNENAEKKKNIPGFKLPEVKFDLAYDNKNGFTQHNFSYASPQKSVQGFPITIEKIDFHGGLEDAKLTITPKLSLAGKNKAFSAAARLVFIATIDIGEKNFSLDGVTLDSIGIDSKCSGFKLKGSLTWYVEAQNKGIRGDLDIVIPIGVGVKLAGEFGTHKEGTNPAFGTAQYYSYWYLDGLASFKPGIPLATGVDLMALGGGFGYNMKLNNEQYYKYNNLSSSMADLEKAKPQGDSVVKSKSVYIPAFDNYICKFSAKIGNKPTYEVFASLTISFNTENNGLGLNKIEFYGNAIFLPETDQKATPSKNYIAAEAKITYDHEHSIFDADFYVYAYFAGGLIQGIGKEASENGAFQHRVVNAKFFFAPHEWYVNIGTLKNRAGLKVGIDGIGTSVKFTSYLMFGYRIPTYLPPLPDKIQNVLGKTSKDNTGDGGNELEGTAAQDNREDRSAFTSQYENGTGIAFGAAAELNYTLDAGIVYAHLWAALGFDINITHSLDRLCGNANNPHVVGKGGWYGQGQVFTGLGGNLGVRVWFFKTYEIDILSLSAAVALQGGFPNPSWFDGRAGVKYSVLGGMISGHANFQLRIGDKCEIISPNPFGLTFIDKINPQGDKVSVLSDIETTFSLPINKIYEIPVDVSDGKNGKKKIRKIAPVLYSYDIFEKDHPDQKLQGVTFLDAENTVAYKKLSEYLKQHTEYIAEVKVRGRECKDATCYPSDINSWDYVLENGSNTRIYEEVKRDTFATGGYPEMLTKFVNYSRPIRNQNFLTPEDNVNKHGLLYYQSKNNNKIMTYDMFNNYFPTKDDRGKDYYYLARYIPQESNKNIIEIPISHSDIHFGHLEYLRNMSLDNNTTYECQIQRLIESKSLIKMDVTESGKQSVGKYNNENLNISAEQYTDKSKITEMQNISDNNVIPNSSDLLNTGMIDNSLNIPVPDYDNYYYDRDILYKYKFTTSYFNTLTDKINSLTLQFNHNISGGCTYDDYLVHPSACDGIDWEDVEISLSGSEGFDVYDLFGDSIAVFYNSGNSPYHVVKFIDNEWRMVDFDNNKLENIKYPPNVLISDPNSHTGIYTNDLKTNGNDNVLNYRIESGFFDDKKILRYINRENNNTNENTQEYSRNRGWPNNEYGNLDEIIVGNTTSRTVLKLKYHPVHNANIILQPVQGSHQQPNQYAGETEALNNYPGYYPVSFLTLDENFKPDASFKFFYNNIPVSSAGQSNLSYPVYRRFMDKPYNQTGIMPVWNATEEETARNNIGNEFDAITELHGGGIFIGGGMGGGTNPRPGGGNGGGINPVPGGGGMPIFNQMAGLLGGF